MVATWIRGPPVSQGNRMLLLLLFSSTFALCATQGKRSQSQWPYSLHCKKIILLCFLHVVVPPPPPPPPPPPQIIYCCRYIMSSSLTGLQCSNCTRSSRGRLYLHHTIIHLQWKSCGLFVLLPEHQ